MAEKRFSYEDYSDDDIYCDYDDYDGDDDVGCIACGNPAYPDCKSSCPMFDD